MLHILETRRDKRIAGRMCSLHWAGLFDRIKTLTGCDLPELSPDRPAPMEIDLIKPKRKNLNPSLRLKIYNRDGGICQICGKKTRFFRSSYDSPFDPDDRVAGSVDHIIPIKHGGTNDELNLRWACRSCNCSRGARP